MRSILKRKNYNETFLSQCYGISSISVLATPLDGWVIENNKLKIIEKFSIKAKNKQSPSFFIKT